MNTCNLSVHFYISLLVFVSALEARKLSVHVFLQNAKQPGIPCDNVLSLTSLTSTLSSLGVRCGGACYNPRHDAQTDPKLTSSESRPLRRASMALDCSRRCLSGESLGRRLDYETSTSPHADGAAAAGPSGSHKSLGRTIIGHRRRVSPALSGESSRSHHGESLQRLLRVDVTA